MAKAKGKAQSDIEYEEALKRTAEVLKEVVGKNEQGKCLIQLFLEIKSIYFDSLIQDTEKAQAKFNELLPENIKIDLDTMNWNFKPMSYSGSYDMIIDHFITTNKQLFK